MAIKKLLKKPETLQETVNNNLKPKPQQMNTFPQMTQRQTMTNTQPQPQLPTNLDLTAIPKAEPMLNPSLATNQPTVNPYTAMNRKIEFTDKEGRGDVIVNGQRLTRQQYNEYEQMRQNKSFPNLSNPDALKMYKDSPLKGLIESEIKDQAYLKFEQELMDAGLKNQWLQETGRGTKELTAEEKAYLTSTPAMPNVDTGLMGSGVKFDKMDLAETGINIATSTAGEAAKYAGIGASAGAAVGALGGPAAPLTVSGGALVGGAIGGIGGAAMGFFKGASKSLSAVSADQREDVKTSMERYDQAINYMNEIQNAANNGADRYTVLTEFQKMKEQIMLTEAELHAKASTETGKKLSKVENDQVEVDYFIQYLLPKMEYDLEMALVAPNPSKQAVQYQAKTRGVD